MTSPAKAGELMSAANATVITPRPMRVTVLKIRIFSWWGVA
jgi:hypothetical protein